MGKLRLSQVALLSEVVQLMVASLVEQDLNPAPSFVTTMPPPQSEQFLIVAMFDEKKKSDAFVMLNFHLLISLLAGSHLCPCQLAPQLWVAMNKPRPARQESLKEMDRLNYPYDIFKKK